MSSEWTAFWPLLIFLPFFIWLMFFQSRGLTVWTPAQRRRAVVIGSIGAVVAVGLLVTSFSRLAIPVPGPVAASPARQEPRILQPN